MTALTSSLLLAGCDSSVASKENKEELVLKTLANCLHLTLNNKNLVNLNKIHMCPNVRILHAFDNKLTEIAPLVQTRYLNAAYLHNNLITGILPDLGMHMKHLTRLYLNRNHISLFRGWAGVQGATLEELHIAGQSGGELTFEEASLKALAHCLKVLDVSHNGLTNLSQLSVLRSLRSFFLDNNRIGKISDVTAVTDRNPALVVCSALNNPCTTGVAKLRQCRDALVLSCAGIEMVNGKHINAAEKTFLREKTRRLANSS